MDFIRTIERDETETWIQDLLAKEEHPYPLPFMPRNAGTGDHMYLCWRGRIIARARIIDIAPRENPVYVGTFGREVGPGSTVVVGGWEHAPRDIAYRGYQGIRYTEPLW